MVYEEAEVCLMVLLVVSVGMRGGVEHRKTSCPFSMLQIPC